MTFDVIFLYVDIQDFSDIETVNRICEIPATESPNLISFVI